MKKRILSLLTAFVLTICCVRFTALAADEPSLKYADEAFTHIQNLGIFDPDAEKDSFLTRGEFAAAVYRIYGKGADTGYGMAFSDVGLADPNRNAIFYCVSCGYMLGSGEQFRPNDPITSIEAMTVIARLLNYTEYAKNNGDYSLGYYTTAKNIGILRNTGIMETNAALTHNTAAVMLYNALRSSMNMLSSVSSLFNTYKTSDKLFAYEALGLNFASGVMSSNGFADVSGNDVYGKNSAVIGNKVYGTKLLDDSFRFYLGQEVSIFYDDDFNIVSLAPTGKSNVINITRDKFEAKSQNTVSYSENDKTVKVKTSADAAYLKNGQPVLDFKQTGFVDAEYAELTLIDSDGDDVYEAVLANIYNTFVVNAVSEDGFLTSVDNTQHADLGTESGKAVFVYNSAGVQCSAFDIIIGSVVSVVENERFVYVIYTNSEISGEVTALADYTVAIDGMEFDVTAKSAAKFSAISLGESVTVYFDYAGRVVKVISGGANINPSSTYGFLVAAKFKNKMKNEIFLKIFNNSGIMKIYEVGQKLTVDEKPYKLSKLADLPSEFFENGGLKNTLVIYNLNDEGKITSVRFPKTALGNDEDGFIKSYSREKASIISNGTLTSGAVKPDKTYFSGYEFLNANTNVFVIPDDLDDEDGYYLIKKGNIPISTNYIWDTYHFSKYNGFADAAIIYGHFTKKSYNTPLSVILSVGETIDAKGEEVYQIKHFYSNNTDVFTAKKDLMIGDYIVDDYGNKTKTTVPVTDLKPGDAVRMPSDIDKRIIDAERVYEYNEDPSKAFKGSSLAGAYATHSLYMTSGYVAYNDRTLMRLAPDKDSAMTVNSNIFKNMGFVYSSAKIAVVNETKDGVTARTGSTADVCVGDFVVYQARAGVGAYLIVYKDKQ